ncbi:uncharacterized protein UMAG_02589 [Mycosarcoma maydis]|uniref:Uncharacterized protein n=1 Tax=Mycosarcoma maydis TaxID=5270 RepID=A0A0D1E011_MYCMD|nr:uncharacterized protein UMAG_02589 [Ustilago maydis 521]KIS69241.1 hypothetical protein UMAG_02589 [Ustilago maydis 521]|eukprot:XP_011388991.1 hypothetical protein UMAG_02589 [Ustilago maydis 521]
MVLIGMRWQHGDGTWHYHGTTAHQHDCQGLLQADAAADVAKCIEYRPGVAKLELSEATNKSHENLNQPVFYETTHRAAQRTCSKNRIDSIEYRSDSYALEEILVVTA